MGELNPTPAHGIRRELLVMSALTVAVTLALVWVGTIPGAGDFVHAGLALAYLMMALRIADRSPQGLEHFGISLGGMLTPRPQEGKPGPLGLFDFGRALKTASGPALRETGVAILMALITFPPFIIGFYYYQAPTQDFVFTLPPELLSLLLTQILVIAIPEEALFRGYFQTRLTDLWPKTRRFLGADIAIGPLLLQAAFFAIVHYIVDWNVARLAVFFPALLFGWLRARRGSIGAGVAYHVMCNLIAEILYRSWLH